jgi:hypothetical protein
MELRRSTETGIDGDADTDTDSAGPDDGTETVARFKPDIRK